MSLPKNRFPHDFKRWHDIRIDQYATARAEADRKAKQELYEQFARIAEKYLPLEHDKRSAFVCIIARSPADLIREGELLDHCVGRMNYDQRFIREESLIFFIRKKEQPDTPLVTLEYSLRNHKVLQCYGEHDHKPSEDVLHYVNKVWLCIFYYDENYKPPLKPATKGRITREQPNSGTKVAYEYAIRQRKEIINFFS